VISVEAVLDGRGVLRSCEVSGHAGAGAAGADIVCAAVSSLVRTAVHLLSRKDGVTIKAAAEKRGELRFEAGYTEAGAASLAAAGEFLLEGLGLIEKEYPGHCKVMVSRVI
jgi:uncharacterized protein YsxB (DUF464 family)